ncbi:hypothetical protein F8271_30400 [Micromonospora sp. ALFpr18c]|uniref:hypothetical protein n=1 Tax=unclassified Micromonospora TaxID=2617518 RepID=UPI00124B28C8|nr:hypothetical protein [Micromonospora sp. ALFpr18c]KAB1925599.1 hypothetical protein F8271_30400 [Micromonospora sp. ALFpr18c]
MVTDPHAALRGLLTGRLRGHERRLHRFAEADWRRYADLLAGALLVAVRRRFVAGQDRAPVIRFVASVRERFDATGRDVDPVLAEALVWAALGERPPVPDSAAVIVARTVLLLGLLEDEGLTDSERDEILTAAAHAANTSTQDADRQRAGAPAPGSARTAL